MLQANDGVLGLPIIRNVKTVDPGDPSSPEVIQIETAMGAAIGVFDGAGPIEVDRCRFLPVKTTSDLLVLRSDAYELTDDCQVRLAASRHRGAAGRPGRAVQAGPATSTRCSRTARRRWSSATRLEVKGDWTFGRDVVVRGTVALPADGGSIPDGTVLGVSAA